MSVTRLVLLALLLAPCRVDAAYAIVNSGAAHTCARSGDHNAVTTGAINSTGADLLILSITTYSGIATMSWTNVSDSTSIPNGNWTTRTAHSATLSGIAMIMQIGYVWGSSVQTNASHTFTFSQTNTYPTACVVAVSGSRTASDPFDSGAGEQFAAATEPGQPGSLTPSQANSLIVSAAADNDDGTGSSKFWTVSGSSYALLNEVEGSSGASVSGALGYVIQTSAAAANPTWTHVVNTTVGGYSQVAFAPPGGGGGSTGIGAKRRKYCEAYGDCEESR